ncbi:MAG: hypothetical protein PHR47_00620 [Candidatus Pacebacteria bacterium]|nr:hypothetical protein [Candidatus Paceibacterota bacterium]
MKKYQKGFIPIAICLVILVLIEAKNINHIIFKEPTKVSTSEEEKNKASDNSDNKREEVVSNNNQSQVSNVVDAKDIKEKFKATEIVSNNLPESIEFWTEANCPDKGLDWPYYTPEGYKVESCSYGEKGSHSGCKTCIMTKIKLQKINENQSVFTNNDFDFQISSPSAKEGDKDFDGSDYDYNLSLGKYSFPDFYFDTEFNVLVSTDKDIVANCNKTYVWTSKLIGENNKKTEYDLPATAKNSNGDVFYYDFIYDMDMMGNYEKISYKKLYNSKCYMLAMSAFFSSYPSKSDIAEDEARMERIKEGRNKRMIENAGKFISILKGFKISENHY